MNWEVGKYILSILGMIETDLIVETDLAIFSQRDFVKGKWNFSSLKLSVKEKMIVFAGG